MFRIFSLYLTALLGLLNPLFSSVEEALNWSTIGPTAQADLVRMQIEKTFPLQTTYKRKELYEVVQKAMNEANPKKVGLSDEESARLSRKVVHTAQCYGIDPIVFTALIWRESNFKPNATSETGAAGLTQMTGSGIHEVLDRLNLRSFRKLKHLRALVKRCDPSVYDRLPVEVSEDIVAAWKNNVAFSTSDALVMGALLLKLNLASRTPSHFKMQVYQSALEHYNGDPKVKVQFAKDVLTLAKRMTSLPGIALNESKFLSMIRGL